MPFKRKENPNEIERIQRELLDLESKLREVEIQHSEEDDWELLSLLEEQSYVDSYNSVYSFLQYAWDSFETVEFKQGKHLQAIGEHLDACVKGEIKNLIINVQPRNCLFIDTPITLANGEVVAIKDIEIGALVKSWTWVYPDNRGLLTADEVVDKVDTGIQEVWRLETKKGRGIEATAQHRLFANNKWQETALIQPGDYLTGIDNLPDIVVSKYSAGFKPTYDIETKRFHCFFAGGILSHNSKTSIVSKAFPAYLWIKQPRKKIINLSYSFDLSVKDSVGSKTIINSPWYQKGLAGVWKDMQGDDYLPWRLSPHTNLKYDYETTVGGRRYATSVEGTVYGSGGDLLIVDDPLNPRDANSKVMREKTNDILGQIFSTRLNDRETGCRILIAQRLCQGDSTDYFLEQGIWEHLVLPTEWDESRRYWTSIGWTDWRVKQGELLNPTRFNEEAILEIKKELGDYGYAAQCQQSPVPLGGGLIKLEWFNTWYVLPSSFDASCMAFDLSMKDSSSSDYTALIVMGRRGSSFYVIDAVYAKMDIVKQVQAIADLCAKYPTVRTRLIEQRANGQAVMDLLGRSISGLIPVNPKGGETKESRIMATIPELNAGNVFIPDLTVKPQIKPLLDEAKMFPKGKHDDMLDAFSYALNYLAVNCAPTYLPIEVITETQETYMSRGAAKQIVQEAGLSQPYNGSIRLNTQKYIHSLFS